MVLDEFLYKIGFEVDKSKIDSVNKALYNLKINAEHIATPIKEKLSANFAQNEELLNNLDNAFKNAKNEAKNLSNEAKNIAKGFEGINTQSKQTTENISQASIATKKQSKSLKSQINEFKDKFFVIGMISTALSGLITKYLSAPLENINKITEQKNRLFDITKAQITQTKEYNELMAKTKDYLTQITTQTAIKLLPVINHQINGFNSFLKANKNLIVSGLSKVFGWVVKLGQVFFNTFKALSIAINATLGWKKALLIAIGVLAIFKRAVISAFIASPIGILTIAIGALMLLLDDLMTYLEGGESLFGDYFKPFINWCKKAKEVFETLKPYLKAELEAVKQIFSGALKFIIGIAKTAWGLLTGDFDLIKQGLDEICSGITQVFNGVIDGIKNKFNALVSYIIFLYDKYIAPIVDSVKNIANSITDGISNAANNIKDGIGKGINGVMDFFGLGDKQAPQVAIAGALGNQSKQVQITSNPVTNLHITTNNPQIAEQSIQRARQNNYNAIAQNFKAFND